MDNSTPRRVDRFTSDDVLAPQPSGPPPAPTGLVATSAPGGLRLNWSEVNAIGYEVRWSRTGESEHSELTIPPEFMIGNLAEGTAYVVRVRAVDAYGRRSEPAEITATPRGRGDTGWRSALTGLLDEFADDSGLRTDAPGSRWHVSGYRGCVEANPGTGDRRGQLVFGLLCGTDQAVLRARSPLLLHDPVPGTGELGRATVITDAAGPSGQLVVDLVPGPVDRIGSAPNAPLPSGTVRVVVNDSGARVLASDTVPKIADAGGAKPAPRRGVGVLHRFEVVLTTSGVRVSQDGQLIATGGVLPDWKSASVLFGFNGPPGVKSRVHVDAAGFSGPAAPMPELYEVPIVPATQRVLGSADQAPDIGVSRAPLLGARSARAVLTVSAGSALDPGRLVLQLGDNRLPLTRAVPGPGVPAGAEVTLYADLPAALLAPGGPDPLSPYTVRYTGDPVTATVVEGYLEIQPGGPVPGTSTRPGAAETTVDGLPTIATTVHDAAGATIDPGELSRGQRVAIDVTLTGTVAQWDSGGVAGVAGLQLWLDGRLVLGLPTDLDGPGLGGRYSLVLGADVLGPGPHVLETREYAADLAAPPVSELTQLTVR
ncbi:fibronectin type III domain-containing protein [Kutzneria viridogrisea]